MSESIEKRLDIPAPGNPNFEARLRETLQVYLGRTGDPLDKGLTVRALKELGILDTVPGTDGKVLQPGPALPRPAPEEEEEDLTPPPTPTGFTLAAGITNVFIEHDPPVYPQGRGHDRTVFYGVKRNEGDPPPTFVEATKLGDFQGEVYAYPSDPATTWYMWITWRTLDGVESVVPAGGISGLMVRTGEDVQRLLDALNGQITESSLNKELSERIDDSTEGIKYLATQYGMRVQVAGDGKIMLGGYGLMGSNEEGRGPSIDFGVLANRFYVGAPATNGGISSTRPFIIQTTPTVINGVNVPAGVYMEDGFIKNGTITNLKVANGAIDDAKIAFLSATKIRAGSIAVGQYIQSSAYSVGGNQGWRINGDGTAEFRQVEVRGGVFASYGEIAGITIDNTGLRTSAYGQGTGFYIGKDGRFSLGTALTWSGTQLNITGNATFSGALSAATGTFRGDLSAAAGTFRGELVAASGTFSGKLTAQAIDAVQTINIAGNAVTVPVFTEGVYGISFPPSPSWQATLTSGGNYLNGGAYVTVTCTVTCTVTSGGDCTMLAVLVGSGGWEYNIFESTQTMRASDKLTVVFVGGITVPFADTWSVRIFMRNSWTDGTWVSDRTSILAIGAKR